MVPEGFQVGVFVGPRLGRRLGGRLERSWEGFGRPRGAQDGPRWCQDEVQDGHNSSKTVLRCIKMHPGGLKMQRCSDLQNNGKNNGIQCFLGAMAVLSRSRRPQDGAKTDRYGARSDQDGAKTRQVGTKTPRMPKRLEMAARLAKQAPRRKTWRPNDPKMVQNGFKTAQDGAHLSQMGPRRST